ncbi:Bax inhibitor 1 family protein [Virgibacillus necropolis]|uniref:Heme ABC transporter n=1 Tax=Virgibacillus necropolis TaxID=163877 RepID=A0A221MA95_9BACI|nr:hypothetical protein [Virgibacillus necropolis]ASN04565.1 hypothetical protein CFK40_05835 [Virgibacillus necropolis]
MSVQEGHNSIDEQTDSKTNVAVWEDVVNIKDLVLSLVICTVTTLGGYLLAPNEPPKPLFFGLVGAIIGFVTCSIIIKPKRTFHYIEEEDE